MDKNQDKKKQFKERQIKALKIIIILLIIHILLNIMRIPISEDKLLETRFSSDNKGDANDTLYETQCFRKQHSWEFEWEGYNEADANSISPRFRLYNTEQRKGTYFVQFGFFNQELHDFERYRGKPYITVKDELPWHAASMHSENISVIIGPSQNRLITSYTAKADRSKVYWVYALVTEPSYTKCESIVLEKNSENKNKTVDETDTQILDENEYITLWDWLMEKIF